MGLRLCLSGKHTQRTICGQEQLQETCNTCRPYLGQHVPGFSSMQLWLNLRLYLGTYKRIDHQNTGLAYKKFCSILQYTIKSKETRIKNKF